MPRKTQTKKPVKINPKNVEIFLTEIQRDKIVNSFISDISKTFLCVSPFNYEIHSEIKEFLSSFITKFRAINQDQPIPLIVTVSHFIFTNLKMLIPAINNQLIAEQLKYTKPPPTKKIKKSTNITDKYSYSKIEESKSYSAQIKMLTENIKQLEKDNFKIIIIFDHFELLLDKKGFAFLYAFLSLFESPQVNIMTFFISRKLFGSEELEKRIRSRLNYEEIFNFENTDKKGEQKRDSYSDIVNDKNKQCLVVGSGMLTDASWLYKYLSQYEKIILLVVLINVSTNKKQSLKGIYDALHDLTINQLNIALSVSERVVEECVNMLVTKRVLVGNKDKGKVVYYVGNKMRWKEMLRKDEGSMPTWCLMYLKGL